MQPQLAKKLNLSIPKLVDAAEKINGLLATMSDPDFQALTQSLASRDAPPGRSGMLQPGLVLWTGIVKLTNEEMIERLGSPDSFPEGVRGCTEFLQGVLETMVGLARTCAAVGWGIAKVNGDEALAQQARRLVAGDDDAATPSEERGAGRGVRRRCCQVPGSHTSMARVFAPLGAHRGTKTPEEASAAADADSAG